MALPFHKLLDALGGGLGSQARAILAAYGTDAHIYLPGVGALNGYTLGNYLDSGGTTPATVDNPVGLVQDAIGSIHVSQGTTASKPILRKPSNNYYWEFDGTNDSLVYAAPPWAASDNYCVTIGTSLYSAAYNHRPFSIYSSTNANPLGMLITLSTTGSVDAFWRDNSATLSIVNGGTYSLGVPLVISARKVGNNKVCRVNGVSGATNTTPIGASDALDRMNFGAWNNIYFHGEIYPTIAIKGTVSDANLLILERWVGSLTGPTGVAI